MSAFLRFADKARRVKVDRRATRLLTALGDQMHTIAKQLDNVIDRHADHEIRPNNAKDRQRWEKAKQRAIKAFEEFDRLKAELMQHSEGCR